jgi:hypothetical protein
LTYSIKVVFSKLVLFATVSAKAGELRWATVNTNKIIIPNTASPGWVTINLPTLMNIIYLPFLRVGDYSLVKYFNDLTRLASLVFA